MVLTGTQIMDMILGKFQSMSLNSVKWL